MTAKKWDKRYKNKDFRYETFWGIDTSTALTPGRGGQAVQETVYMLTL